MILDVIDPPLGKGRLLWINLLLFFVGTGLCLSFMLTDASRPHMWFVAAGLTLMRGLTHLRSRWRWLPRLIVLLFIGFWVYEAVAFGLLLAWVTPAWIRLATPLLLGLAIGTGLRPIRGVRVPMGLALGPWILSCLLGWRHHDGMLRCVDLRRVLAEKALSIVVPTFPAELPATCQDGETFVVGRYPRRLWEAPEGGRLVVTTQFFTHFTHPGKPLPPRFDGSICEVKLDGGATRCFGRGTAQAIGESEHDDRLYIAAYQQKVPGYRGVIYALSRQDPMRVLVERRFRGDTGEFYLDPGADLMGVAFDQVTELVPVRASDLTPDAPIPARFDPGDTRYDTARSEGIFCFAAGPLFPDQGQGYASVAFHGVPFRHRLLAPTSQYPSSWATLSWGCDFDPLSRRAFVSSANLGWLGVIDYDSGRYLSRPFVGLGVRTVTWDPARRVVYLSDFLRGEVFAVDPESGRETARWFVGRFVRQVLLSRDGHSLWVTSTAGVVRIAL